MKTVHSAHSPAVFAIVVSEKGGAERREIFGKAEITLGRVQGNDLVLPKGNVSKRHARLSLLDGRFVVTDQNSTNGTYVNRRRISQPTIVREGDRIYIGDFVLRLEGAEGEEPAAPRPGSIPDSVAADGTGKYPAQRTTGMIPERPTAQPSGASASLERVVAEHADGAPEEPTAQRTAVKLVVEAVTRRLEPRALDQEVTDTLRSRVERLVEERLRALGQEGAIEAQVDEEQAKEAAIDELLDIGPIARLLSDPAVTEIVVRGTGAVTVSRGAERTAVEPPFSSTASLLRVVARICRRSGSALSEGESVVERRLSEGVRFQALISPAARNGPWLVFQRAVRHQATLEDLVRTGTVSRAIATFLRQCVLGRANILVIGPREARPALLLSALADAVDDGPVVAAIRQEEFSTRDANLTVLDVADDHEAESVIPFTAALGNARLIIEQLSGRVAAATLDAVAQGASGVAAGLNATGVRRGLARLVADLATTRSSLSPQALREWIAAAFDIVIEVAGLADGRQRVLRVAEIRGTETDGIELTDIFTFVIQRMATGGSIEGSFHATGVEPALLYELRARGVALDSAIFARPPNS